MLANGDQLSCYNFLDELELEVQVQVQDCEGLVLVEDGTAAMKGFVQHLKVSQLEVVGLKQESDLNQSSPRIMTSIIFPTMFSMESHQSTFYIWIIYRGRCRKRCTMVFLVDSRGRAR